MSREQTGGQRHKPEYEHRRDIVEVCRRMYDRGFIAATDGNVSVRISPTRILVTPTGINKGYIKPDDLLTVDLQGRKTSGTRRATSEMPLHLTTYRLREDVNAVVHGHPVHATALSLAGVSLARCILPELVLSLGEIPTTAYATPTTEEGPEVVSDLIRDYDAMILDRHGSLTVGGDLFEAYDRLERLEHSAQVTLLARSMGEVKQLTPDQVSRLGELAADLGVRSEVHQCEGCGSCGRPDCH